MKTVKELKEAGKFVVEEWQDVMRARGETCIGTGYKTHEYVFKYDDGDLFIKENTDKAEEFQIFNVENVLNDVAKEECILWAHIIPLDGLPFNLYNPRIRFLK